MVPSSGRGVSTGQGEVLECPHCHRRHLGMSRLLTRGCFRCRSTEHLIENYPRESGDNRSLQGSGRGRSVAPPSTGDRGKGRGGPIQHRRRGGTVSETVDHPMPTAPARAYAMKAREDQDATEVIADIFSLYDIEMHALIDLGSTHSYICTEHVFDKMSSIEQLPYDMLVTSSLRHSVRVNRVYKNCHLMTHDREFYADLLALPFHEFDLILGMDWLSKHRVIVDCDMKTIRLKFSDLSQVTVHGIQSGAVSNVILAMQARRLLRKGCEAFLALVIDSKRGQIELENILAVKDFPDVFSEELPDIPHVREVDLSIEILLGTTPTSRAPYRMAPTELKELKIQLQELLDKGFIRPGVSPWGAPVLFVKKKDDTLRMCIDYC